MDWSFFELFFFWVILYRDRVASQNVTSLSLWVSDVTSNQTAYWKPGVFYFTFPVFPHCLPLCQSQETYVTFHAKSGSKLEMNSKSFCTTNLSLDISRWNVSDQFQWCSFTAYFVITFFPNCTSLNRFPPETEQQQKAKDRRCLQMTTDTAYTCVPGSMELQHTASTST